jgi:hypothetical protein
MALTTTISPLFFLSIPQVRSSFDMSDNPLAVSLRSLRAGTVTVFTSPVLSTVFGTKALSICSKNKRDLGDTGQNANCILSTRNYPKRFKRADLEGSGENPRI